MAENGREAFLHDQKWSRIPLTGAEVFGRPSDGAVIGR